MYVVGISKIQEGDNEGKISFWGVRSRPRRSGKHDGGEDSWTKALNVGNLGVEDDSRQAEVKSASLDA